MKIFKLGSGIAFLTLTFAGAAWSQPDQTPQNFVTPRKPPRVRATEPGKQIVQDLLEFAELINTGQIYPDGQKWIHGARQGFFGANEWVREADILKMRPVGITLKIDNLTVDEIEGETATATVTYSYTSPNGLGAEQRAVLTTERNEVLQLRLGALPFNKEKTWQIVPPEAMPAARTAENGIGQLEDIWAKISFVLAQKATLKLPNSKAKRSMTNIKQLSLGVMQFLQDYNERYAFAPEYLEEAIMPYVKAKTLFFVPDSQEHYSFNAHLSDTSFNDLKDLIKTVMFYEGTDEKPVFRYDGKAAIGFADGHVVLMTPEQAKTLIWKP